MSSSQLSHLDRSRSFSIDGWWKANQLAIPRLPAMIHCHHVIPCQYLMIYYNTIIYYIYVNDLNDCGWMVARWSFFLYFVLPTHLRPWGNVMIRPKVSMSGLSMMPSSRSMRCPETYQAPLMSAFTLGALKSTSITSFWSFLVSLYI